ncbi:hypothetical protein K469DRAFT_716340 [Zopfia rhizophila CBS 207.26]|uniref:Uncharacterized protein n=1 Tax=Zopfia rhizophila CBS 207.26 TaxID=1314779 RepID=A0A6A6DJN3_9PEZI|nr:hypothetical protein K469DRAFT_716340 [Zopfia rhizophila CBS 207.26]
MDPCDNPGDGSQGCRKPTIPPHPDNEPVDLSKITCSCGFGYFKYLQDEDSWVSGADVRAGREPPNPRKVEQMIEITSGDDYKSVTENV